MRIFIDLCYIGDGCLSYPSKKKKRKNDENEEQEQENGAFSPSEGLWEFSTPDLEGDCFAPMEDADTGAEEMEQMNLTVNDDTSFTLTIMDEEENSVLACTRSDMSFTCDPEIIEIPIDEEGMMLIRKSFFPDLFHLKQHYWALSISRCPVQVTIVKAWKTLELSFLVAHLERWMLVS